MSIKNLSHDIGPSPRRRITHAQCLAVSFSCGWAKTVVWTWNVCYVFSEMKRWKLWKLWRRRANSLNLYYVCTVDKEYTWKWSSQLWNNLKLQRKFFFEAPTGFEAMSSVIPVQCSTDWAMIELRLKQNLLSTRLHSSVGRASHVYRVKKDIEKKEKRQRWKLIRTTFTGNWVDNGNQLRCAFSISLYLEIYFQYSSKLEAHQSQGHRGPKYSLENKFTLNKIRFHYLQWLSSVIDEQNLFFDKKGVGDCLLKRNTLIGVTTC